MLLKRVSTCSYYIHSFSKNNDISYVHKEKVVKSCLIPVVLYGCEAWFPENVRPLDTLYLSSVKAILGVR